MAGFADWIALESLLDELEKKMLLERAVLETISMVLHAVGKEEYNEGSPKKPVWQSPEVQRILDNPVGDDQPSDSPVNPKRHEEDLKRIADALKVLKSDAIRKRSEKVKELARLADSGADLEAVPLLAELGYFGRTDSEGQNETTRKVNYHLGGAITGPGGRPDRKADEKEKYFRSVLTKALESAANEEGNEPPEGGFPSQEEVIQANQNLADSLKRVLGNRLRNLAFGNQSRKGLGKGRVGHREYEIDDLGDEVVVGLLNRFTKRKWGGSGNNRTLKSWDYDDVALDNPNSVLVGYLMNTAKNQPEKIRRRGSPPPEFFVSNGPKKASVLRSDLKNNDLGFYSAYIRAAEERPLRAEDPKGKDRDPKEEIILAKGDDLVRRSIMQDIEVEVVDNNTSGMSLDPRKIKDTLDTYLKTRLAPYYRQVIPASQISGEAESSDDAVLSGVWSDRHSGRSRTGTFGPRGGGAAHRFPMTTGRSGQNMLFDMLRPFVVKAIDDISNGYTPPRRPTGARSGPREALALCIKFGISCVVTTKKERGGIVPATVSPLGQGSLVPDERLKDFFRQASEREGWSWEAVCRTAFKEYGINSSGGGLATIASKWSEYPSGTKEKLTPRSLKSIDEYLNGSTSGSEASPGGLVKLCGRMEELIKF